MKISKPSSRGIMSERDQPRNEGRNQAERSERVHSGEKRSENKKDPRVAQEARRQLESLDFRNPILATAQAATTLLLHGSSQSACFKSCFLFIHELRDASCRIKGRRAVQNTPTGRNFPSAITEIRCYPRLRAGGINGSIDSRSRNPHHPRHSIDEKLLSAVVIERDSIAPAAVQITAAIKR